MQASRNPFCTEQYWRENLESEQLGRAFHGTQPDEGMQIPNGNVGQAISQTLAWKMLDLE